MVGELIYAFRVMRLPLLDTGGAPIGKIDDIVVVSGRATEAPRVLGFVATSQRRSIFVSASRIASLDNSGARLKSWDVDLNPFRARDGERLLGREILDQKIGDETVSDVALRPTVNARETGWEVAKVRLTRSGLFGRRNTYRLVEWKAPGAAPDTAVLELYDYQKDSLEKKNIAAEDVTTVASLRKILNQYPEAQPQVAPSDKGGPKGKRGKKNEK